MLRQVWFRRERWEAFPETPESILGLPSEDNWWFGLKTAGLSNDFGRHLPSIQTTKLLIALGALVALN